MTNKHQLTRNELISLGGEPVLEMRVDSVFPKKDPTLARPGFYFIADTSNELVVARYFVGNQRTKIGFNEKISRFMLNPRSEVDRKLNDMIHTDLNTLLVIYVPYNLIKSILNPEKGQLSLMFTKNPTSVCQNFSEINRELNDKYNFYLQSY